MNEHLADMIEFIMKNFEERHTQYCASIATTLLPYDGPPIEHGAVRINSTKMILTYIDEAVEPLLRGLKEGRDLIYLLGSSPLELASKYGPDYEPPTEEEIVGQWQGIEDALATWKHDNPAECGTKMEPLIKLRDLCAKHVKSTREVSEEYIESGEAVGDFMGFVDDLEEALAECGGSEEKK